MATTSRITPGPGQDNTGRNFAFDYQTPAYAAVLNINTLQFDTSVVPLPLTGNTTLNLGVGSALAPPYVGDILTFLFAATVAATVTFGTGVSVSSNTLPVSAGKFASISFQFIGTVWVETGRATGL